MDEKLHGWISQHIFLSFHFALCQTDGLMQTDTRLCSNVLSLRLLTDLASRALLVKSRYSNSQRLFQMGCFMDSQQLQANSGENCWESLCITDRELGSLNTNPERLQMRSERQMKTDFWEKVNKALWCQSDWKQTCKGTSNNQSS